MRKLTLVLSAAFCASAMMAAQTIDLSRYQIVDLSHAYGAGTLYWPTSTSKFGLKQEANGPTPGGWFYSASTLSTPEHGGTHLDAPRALLREGTDRRRDSARTARRAGRRHRRDGKGRRDRDYRLTRDDVLHSRRAHGTIARGHDRAAADRVEPPLAEREGLPRRRHAGRRVEAVVSVVRRRGGEAAGRGTRRRRARHRHGVDRLRPLDRFPGASHRGGAQRAGPREPYEPRSAAGARRHDRRAADEDRGRLRRTAAGDCARAKAGARRSAFASAFGHSALPKRPSQHHHRDGEIDHEAGHVDERGDKRAPRRPPGRSPAGA